MSIIRGKLPFLLLPEDWVGRMIEVFADGEVMLDSGLLSKERKGRGERPVAGLLIRPETTREFISSWLREKGIYKYE